MMIIFRKDRKTVPEIQRFAQGASFPFSTESARLRRRGRVFLKWNRYFSDLEHPVGDVEQGFVLMKHVFG